MATIKPPYVSTGEFAKRHNVQAQTVRLWVEAGDIPGVVQVGGRWLIPHDAERPADKRLKPG